MTKGLNSGNFLHNYWQRKQMSNYVYFHNVNKYSILIASPPTWRTGNIESWFSLYYRWAFVIFTVVEWVTIIIFLSIFCYSSENVSFQWFDRFYSEVSLFSFWTILDHSLLSSGIPVIPTLDLLRTYLSRNSLWLSFITSSYLLQFFLYLLSFYYYFLSVLINLFILIYFVFACVGS